MVDALFPVPAQPRRRKAEEADLYRAVVVLRKARYHVYRAGRDHHVVDGVRRGKRWLLRHARAIEEAMRGE